MPVVMRLLGFLLALFMVLAPAMAQAPAEPAPQVTIDKKKLLVQPRDADGRVKQASFWQDPVLWARGKQQSFYRAMSGALRDIKTGAPLAAAWTLMLLSFGYGVLHAAGPGHGKAVISAWLLATEHELHRGVLIAFLSAIIQAVTAILIVSILLVAVASAGAAARDVAGVLESASYGLIALIGLYLVWTAFRPHAHAHRDHGRHGHHHDHECADIHVPGAKQVKGAWSLTKACSLAFAVGIRPCTGAILVLIFANAVGLYWAGIASTFAMAVGTFLTVSAIAAIAVYSKKLALRLARRDDRWLDWAGFALRFGGGAAIVFLGAILFLGSLGASNAMM
ncbi:MAG: nickel/cobalt transporter [Hyphomicrobiales bacterium]